MSLSPTDETELLTALHDGVLDPAPWATFLARLRRRLRADDTALLLERNGTMFAPPFHLPSGETRLDLATLYVADPHPFARLRPQRVHTADEFAVDTGFGGLRIVRVAATDGAGAWLAAARRTGDFNASDGAVLSALAPHVAIAVRTWTALATARRHAGIAADALARLGVGWVTLDARGTMLDRSDHADRLLGPSRGSIDGPMVVSVDPRVELVPRSRSDAEGRAALVRGPVAAADPDTLAVLLGVSRQEARLAVALAAGASIVEAGAALGLTPETARNYSKRLYARTGTRGQADLVRAVLNGAAMLA